MNDKQFIDSLAGLRTQQDVYLDSSGTLINANLTQVSNFIATQIAKSESVTSALTDLSTEVLEKSTEITESLITALIVWIVRIVLIIVTFFIMLYMINLVIELLTLYAL